MADSSKEPRRNSSLIGASTISPPVKSRIVGNREGGAKASQSNADLGGVDGERTPPQENLHDNTQGAPVAGARNPPGDGGEAQYEVVELRWAEPLKLDDIRRRFEVMTAARLTREQTRVDYWNRFKAFALCKKPGCGKLTRYTRKQLATGNGKKAKELLICHYAHISPRSRPWAMTAIRRVWTRGIDLPWPLATDDLPRPLRPGRARAPRREYVAQWVEAVRQERDAYEQSWFLVELNGGLRPMDQQAELQIEDLVFNPAGDVVGIHAEAARHGFKRDADVRQLLPPEVAEGLRNWLKQHPAPKPQAFIWPWRGRVGNLRWDRMSSEETVRRMRRNFVKRHHLPWLTSKDMRHFVRTVLNDSSMPKVERHYWQGHAPNLADMDEQYGDRPPDETFEVQRRHLPQGVLGTFLRTEAVGDGMPAEAHDIWNKLVAGELDTFEAATALKGLIRVVRQRQTPADFVKP